jgi:hypothetical protein
MILPLACRLVGQRAGKYETAIFSESGMPSSIRKLGAVRPRLPLVAGEPPDVERPILEQDIMQPNRRGASVLLDQEPNADGGRIAVAKSRQRPWMRQGRHVLDDIPARGRVRSRVSELELSAMGVPLHDHGALPVRFERRLERRNEPRRDFRRLFHSG